MIIGGDKKDDVGRLLRPEMTKQTSKAKLTVLLAQLGVDMSITMIYDNRRVGVKVCLSAPT